MKLQEAPVEVVFTRMVTPPEEKRLQEKLTSIDHVPIGHLIEFGYAMTVRGMEMTEKFPAKENQFTWAKPLFDRYQKRKSEQSKFDVEDELAVRIGVATLLYLLEKEG